MVDASLPRSSPLAMTALLLLAGGPMHPYEMQRRIKQWGKDLVVNVGQRANLYKTVERLNQAGLVAIRQTERDHRFPERTVYELTEDGLRVGLEWLADMLATPRNEFPRFPAALSFVMLLPPSKALGALEARSNGLRGRLAQLDSEPAAESLPRLYFLETEYLRAVIEAELRWVEGIVEELRSGTLTWSREQVAEDAAAFLLDPPDGGDA